MPVSSWHENHEAEVVPVLSEATRHENLQERTGVFQSIIDIGKGGRGKVSFRSWPLYRAEDLES